MVGPDRRERRGGKGRGGDERDGEKQRAAHASFTAVVATPATGASKASRLPAQGWAASRSGVSPFCAVVTKRVRMSGPPKQDRKSTRRTPVTNEHLVCRLLLEKNITDNNTRI